MPDLLFEIGTEEIPAGYIRPALEQLASLFRQAVDAERLAARDIETLGTPRRLALWATAIPERQEPAREELVGPPARVAFDADGRPTNAALGFARKNGVPPESLRRKSTPKGEYLCAVREIAGRPAVEVLKEILEKCIAGIVFPKSMYWAVRGRTFARPVRWLMALLGEDVVPVEMCGIAAGRTTFGHPFLAPGPIGLARADLTAYRAGLRERYVIAGLDERREMIEKQVTAILDRHDAQISPDEAALLDEVTNLVEYPFAVEGRFEQTYLNVPADITVAAMKGHQRYFPVRGKSGRLEAAFVTVTNRTAAEADLVREGNERVLRARLDDARFFWDDERDVDLDGLVDKLKDVAFLGGLGSNYDRAVRLESVSGAIASKMGLARALVDAARRAGRLAKADLVTGLVGQFTELQGVIGREIALAQKVAPEIALAIGEHYLPRFATDVLPETPTGIAVSLADRIDVIVGCFSVDLLPSGSQDPYALRRNANGILRILDEKAPGLTLSGLIADGLDGYGIKDSARREDLTARILGFFRDRLMQIALDRGYGHDMIRAVMASALDDVPDFWLRLRELQRASAQDWWPALLEVVERTWRIHKGAGLADEVRTELLSEPAEQELWAAYSDNIANFEALARQQRYYDFSAAFADRLAGPVHRFFDEVFVNVDDAAVKANRLTLCARLHRLYARHVADLAVIGQG